MKYKLKAVIVNGKVHWLETSQQQPKSNHQGNEHDAGNCEESSTQIRGIGRWLI